MGTLNTLVFFNFMWY